MTDQNLLKQFVDGDDEAFGRIVERHVDLVFAAAARQLVDRSLAEDVTQAVFIVLARKARLIDGRMLAGWLVNAARLVAKEMRRNEARRKMREQKAAKMKSELDEDAGKWERIGPVLDEALSHLGEVDRTAVTLRYLEGRPLPELAVTMGISEAAASKRLSRAVAKLRDRLARLGVEMPIATIGITLLENSRVMAPAGLVAKSTVAAVAAKSAAVGAASVGSASATSATAGASGASGTAGALAQAAMGAFTTGGISVWSAAIVTAIALSVGFAGFQAVKHLDRAPVAPSLATPMSVIAPLAAAPLPPAARREKFASV